MNLFCKNGHSGTGFTLCQLLICILVFFVVGCRDNNYSPKSVPIAKEGILDLSGWDCGRDGAVRLDGEWQLYRHRLLDPVDFFSSGQLEPEEIYPVPSSLNFDDSNNNENPFGFATLKLRIIPPSKKTRLRIQMDAVNAAYTLWLNGELVAQSGIVETTAESEMPTPFLQLIPVPKTDQPLELVLQLSNFHFSTAGLVNSILLGTETDLLFQQKRDFGLVMFSIGALLLIGLYHIGLYCFHRKDLLPIYLAFYCFLWGGYYFTSGVSNWPVLHFFPTISAGLLEQIAWSCFLLSLPVILKYYLMLYPDEFSKKVVLGFTFLSLCFIGLVVGADTMVFAEYSSYSFLVAACSIFYSIACLIRAWICKRDGAVIILVGTFLLGFSGLADMLSARFVLGIPPLVTYGVLLLVMAQALTLSQRFAKSFSAVEMLSGQLKKRNLLLKGEIEERTRLEREIVNISEDERRKVSVDLHDGICQQLTGARLRCAALLQMQQVSNKEQDELSKLSDLLDELVDQAYDLSCGIWPLEHGDESSGPSLKDMVRRYSRSSGIPIEFRGDKGCTTCQNAQMTQLYRIAQEAITNAIKHAKPEKILVSLTCQPNETINLTVRDDGIGLRNGASSKGGLGMSIMLHRAEMIGGSLEIVDHEEDGDSGTSVSCHFPCMEKDIERPVERSTPR